MFNNLYSNKRTRTKPFCLPVGLLLVSFSPQMECTAPLTMSTIEGTATNSTTGYCGTTRKSTRSRRNGKPHKITAKKTEGIF